MSRKTLFQVAVINHEQTDNGTESELILEPEWVLETDAERARQRAFMMACEIEGVDACGLEETEYWSVIVVPFR